VRRFRNWGRTVSTRPTAWLAPASEAEVIEAIRGAAGQRVRVVGGGHSWSAIAAPEQIGMTLDGFTGITARTDTTVTVRAGTRLKDLNAALAESGHALPIVGSIAEQAMAGAIATGTHGSSLVHGNLASLVERIRLVDGRGAVHDLAAGDPRLPAARVHLGALGVLTEITFRILPAFRLAETIEGIRIGDLPAQLAAIAASAEYVKVWWMPHTKRALIFRYGGAGVVFGPEHAQLLAKAGFSRAGVQAWLAEHCGRTRADLRRAGKNGVGDNLFGVRYADDGVDPGDDTVERILASPEQVPVIVAGSRNAAMSMVVRVFGLWSGQAVPIDASSTSAS